LSEEWVMSVMVVIKVPGDTAKARAFFAAHGEEMRGIAASAKDVGALRHKFAEGDGEIVVFDEWSSRAEFEKFFADPKIAELMSNAGASGPPVIEYYEALETADAF
jgi:quinol monooxygenase YgiN